MKLQHRMAMAGIPIVEQLRERYESPHAEFIAAIQEVDSEQKDFLDNLVLAQSIYRDWCEENGEVEKYEVLKLAVEIAEKYPVGKWLRTEGSPCPTQSMWSPCQPIHRMSTDEFNEFMQFRYDCRVPNGTGTPDKWCWYPYNEDWMAAR